MRTICQTLAMAIVCLACSDVGHRPARATGADEELPGTACHPTWVYLKNPRDVESRRGIDLAERNIVLIGCSEDLQGLTGKDRDALEVVFKDILERQESDLREMVKDTVARGKVTAEANRTLGRPVVGDWYVDFWNMAC